MYNIAFAGSSDERVVTAAACPVCGVMGSDLSLSVCLDNAPEISMNLLRCDSCGSHYVADPDVIKSYNEFSGYWHRYVQNGAGITAMLDPLFALGDIKGSLLDVGCGFGFVPHYWSTMGYGRSVGLEASEYGQIGREKLGTEIYSEYYSEAKTIHGERFDFVFSSEVLEHVSDPAGFIKEISAALSDSGVLVLTTPSSRAVGRDTDAPTLIAAVSPFLHYFLISADALKSLLQRCGYEHVQVYDDGIRLFAWASKQPLPRISVGFVKWTEYFSYLAMLGDHEDPHVSSGALYRLLKDAINTGQFAWADRAYLPFRKVAKAKFDIDFDDPERTAERCSSPEALDCEIFPAWAGCGLLFAGRYKEECRAPSESVLRLAKSALVCMAHEVRVGAAFAQEAIYFTPMAAKLADRFQADLDSRWEIKTAAQLPLKVIRQPVSLVDREVCLIVGYAPDGKLTPAAKGLIEAFSRENFDCVVCYVVPNIDIHIDLDGVRESHGVIVRLNGGYDFAAWAAALERVPGLWAARRIVFINDSIIGPGSTFPAMIEKIRHSSADFLALVDSNEPLHHAQSFFFVLQNEALQSLAVKLFWSSVRSFEDKQAVIDSYELKMLAYLRKVAGLRIEVLYSLESLFPGAAAVGRCSSTQLTSYGRLCFTTGSRL